jgi:hypothetical protein
MESERQDAEIVVNGETVGYGFEGMLNALAKMLDAPAKTCRHGLRFDVHCKQCSLAGFCGCPECVEHA